MMRSVSGTAWRGANNQQQQQATLQRSVSHPGNVVEQQRPLLPPTAQTMRPGSGIQQIRPTTNMVMVNNVLQQASPSHLQQSAQQLPGLVRQVRLVNPPQQQLLQQTSVTSEHAAQDSNQQFRGQLQQNANSGSFQSAQRVTLTQQPQVVKLGVTQQQADNKLPQQQQQNTLNVQLQHQPQVMATTQQVGYSQIVQQPVQQQQVLNSQTLSQPPQQQHHFQQFNESMQQSVMQQSAMQQQHPQASNPQGNQQLPQQEEKNVSIY